MLLRDGVGDGKAEAGAGADRFGREERLEDAIANGGGDARPGIGDRERQPPVSRAGADASRAQRVAGRLRHGTVWINEYNRYLPQAEWGGFKQSGIGRELGPEGIAPFTEYRSIILPPRA